MNPSLATNQLYGLAGCVASLRLSSSEKEEASRTLVAPHPTRKAYLWHGGVWTLNLLSLSLPQPYFLHVTPEMLSY